MTGAYRSDLIDLSVVLVRETDKAFLVDAGMHGEIWVPKSQCQLDPGGPGKVDTLTLPEWLAKEKGLI